MKNDCVRLCGVKIKTSFFFLCFVLFDKITSKIDEISGRMRIEWSDDIISYTVDFFSFVIYNIIRWIHRNITLIHYYII